MEEIMKVTKRVLTMLIISLGLILISGFFASMLQTDFYSVEVIDIRENFGDSVQYSALLYKPREASADNPLPAIVLSHGYLNNRELQAQNAVELSRRGFIVMTVDRVGHGHSALPANATASLTGNNRGMINAVEWLYKRDYVDKNMIGLSGHSMGGYDTAITLSHYLTQENNAITAYYTAQGVTAGTATPEQVTAAKAAGNAANKVSAALITAWSTFMGAPSRAKVGNLGSQYDEFFYKESTAGSDEAIFNATLDPNDPETANNTMYEYLPRDFYKAPNAKNFIKTILPTFAEDEVELGKFYTATGIQNFDHENPANVPFRVIYQPNEIHPRNHFSMETAGYITTFFYAAFGLPEGHNYIAPSNQIWWVKEFFNLVGMVGFFMLLLPLADLLLSTKFFSSLKKAPKEGNLLKGWQRYVAFFGTGTVISLLAGFLIRYFYLDKWGWGTRFFPLTQRFPQPTTNPVAVWAVALGIIGVLIWLVGFILVGRKQGDQPLEALKIDKFSFWKTVLLTFSIVTGLYITLYIVDAVFKTDFRIWSFDIRTFEAIKIATIIRYTMVFAVFYCMNAFINSQNRFKNLPEWATTAITAFFNVFGIVLVMIIQYATFRSTGALWQWDMALGYIVLFPIVPVLILAAIFARQLYLRTGSIWLAGFVNALLFTAITVANTATNFNYILF